MNCCLNCNLQDFAIKYYRGKGVPGKKLIVGIATYGRSYNLSTSFSGVGAPITGPAPSAKYTNESGVMSNYEVIICENIY